MFYFYTLIYFKSCFKSEFPSSAKHKRYFEEGIKPNSRWFTVFPTVKVNVDQQLFGFLPSSKYLQTDVNVCGAVKYIDTAAPELQLIECALYQDIRIFLQKQIVEISLSGPLLAKCALSRTLLLCPLPQILWK